MTPTDFKHSLAGSEPPDGLVPALLALWWAGKDDWNKAHQWVHAHLHRVEGDLDNAVDYWYRRAGRSTATGDSRLGMGSDRGYLAGQDARLIGRGGALA